jgi:hypothetical protein
LANDSAQICLMEDLAGVERGLVASWGLGWLALELPAARVSGWLLNEARPQAGGPRGSRPLVRAAVEAATAAVGPAARDRLGDVVAGFEFVARFKCRQCGDAIR